jgi:hypothetical protein
MKKLNIIGIALFLVLAAFQAQAQCNSELYVNKSMKSLETGFQFSKSYRIDGRAGTRKKIEYTCVFSKDTNYQIRISGKDGGANGIIGTLYDSKRNEMVSSFYNNKFLDGWTFKCQSTGIYYLTFTFKNSQSYCGAAVLAFRR